MDIKQAREILREKIYSMIVDNGDMDSAVTDLADEFDLSDREAEELQSELEDYDTFDKHEVGAAVQSFKDHVREEDARLTSIVDKVKW